MNTLASLAAAGMPASESAGDRVRPLLKSMGIASTSFMGGMLGRRSSPQSARGSGSQNVMSAPPAAGRDTLAFLERCHALGAAGIQTRITGDPHKLRARGEELGMWIEAMLSVRTTDLQTLEHEITIAKEAGCTLARDGLLGGRRYETFSTLADWEKWLTESKSKLEAALPLFEKHRFTLALENHKDWTLEQYVSLFHDHRSEYFGACLDFGNNISLLDNPAELIEAAAPYTKSTHFKDVAVAAYGDGFLLSEVPLGTGVLDLPRALQTLVRANPRVRLSLEMITRDPLKVPCLTDKYWATFPDRNGIYLARTLRFVHEHAAKSPLPEPEELSAPEHAKAEEDNIRACFAWARSQV